MLQRSLVVVPAHVATVMPRPEAHTLQADILLAAAIPQAAAHQFRLEGAVVELKGDRHLRVCLGALTIWSTASPQQPAPDTNPGLPKLPVPLMRAT